MIIVLKNERKKFSKKNGSGDGCVKSEDGSLCRKGKDMRLCAKCRAVLGDLNIRERVFIMCNFCYRQLGAERAETLVKRLNENERWHKIKKAVK